MQSLDVGGGGALVYIGRTHEVRSACLPTVRRDCCLQLTVQDDEEEDLLGMVEGTKSTKPKDTAAKPAATKSLAERVRSAADTLVALLKPSPMKPSGLKAQRKKRQTPIGVTLDIDAPANLSLFSSLIEEEKAFRSGSRMSVESVSFTQQKPFKMEEPKPVGVGISGSGTNAESGQVPPAFSSEMPSSFQHPSGGEVNSRHRPGDPFLLSSTPSRVETDSDNERPQQAKSFWRYTAFGKR